MAVAKSHFPKLPVLDMLVNNEVMGTSYGQDIL